MTCPTCGKIVYASYASAARKGRRIAKQEGFNDRRAGKRHRAYKCPRSFGWHLTRIKTLREHLERVEP